MTLAYLIMGKGGGESTKILGAGKIFRWFAQSILSDVESTQCQGNRGSLLSAPLLSLDLPVA